MQISSSAFRDGKPIPSKYAYQGVVGGKNISIPLSWGSSPPDAKSFALSIVDPHPVARNWVHWIVINIPKEVSSLSEGASCKSMPEGSKEFYNSYGTLGYGGPQPPKGSGPHPYEVTVYALNTDQVDLPANTTLATFLKIIEGNVLASTKTTGIYER